MGTTRSEKYNNGSRIIRSSPAANARYLPICAFEREPCRLRKILFCSVDLANW